MRIRESLASLHRVLNMEPLSSLGFPASLDNPRAFGASPFFKGEFSAIPALRKFPTASLAWMRPSDSRRCEQQEVTNDQQAFQFIFFSSARSCPISTEKTSCLRQTLCVSKPNAMGDAGVRALVLQCAPSARGSGATATVSDRFRPRLSTNVKLPGMMNTPRAVAMSMPQKTAVPITF